MDEPKRVRPGEPLPDGLAYLESRWLNWLVAEIRATTPVVGQGGHIKLTRTPGGTTLIAETAPDAFWATPTGAPVASGSVALYPWKRLAETAGGGFADDVPSEAGTTGDDPLIEANGNMSLPIDGSYRIWAERQPSGDLVGRASAC